MSAPAAARDPAPRAPAGRVRVRRLFFAFALLALGTVASLAWRWDAFTPRAWPVGWPNGWIEATFTDDGQHVVLLRTDSSHTPGTVALLEVANPLDRWLGPRFRVTVERLRTIVPCVAPTAERIVFTDSGFTVGISFASPRAPLVEELPGLELVNAAAHGPADLLVANTWNAFEVRRLSKPATLLWTARDAGRVPFALAPDGRTIALARDAGIEVRDAASGEVLSSFPAPWGPGPVAAGDRALERSPPLGLSFDSAGTLLVTPGALDRRTTYDGGFRIERLDASGAHKGTILLDPGEAVVAATREGGRVLTWRVHDENLWEQRVRDAVTGEILDVRGRQHVSTAAISPDGRLVVLTSGGEEDRLRLFPVPEPRADYPR